MSKYDKFPSSLRGAKTGLAILAILLLLSAVSHWLATRQKGEPVQPPMPANGVDLHALSPQPLSDASRAAPFHGVASCNIGYIDGNNFGPGDAAVFAGTVGLGGWVIDEVNRSVPSFANLVFFNDQVGEGFSVRVTNWLTRPDVQDSHGGEAVYRKPGFVEEADLARLPIGRYHVYMTFTSGGSTYTCDNGRFINLIQRR